VIGYTFNALWFCPASFPGYEHGMAKIKEEEGAPHMIPGVHYECQHSSGPRGVSHVFQPSSLGACYPCLYAFSHGFCQLQYKAECRVQVL